MQITSDTNLVAAPLHQQVIYPKFSAGPSLVLSNQPKLIVGLLFLWTADLFEIETAQVNLLSNLGVFLALDVFIK